MKDIGVRIARQKLLRYRAPESRAARWRRLILVGAALWAAWALLASDHSVSRLLRLADERDRLARELVQSRQELEQAEKQVPSEKPTPGEAERLLRENHTFAKEGELIYLYGADSTARPAHGKSR